MLITRTWHYRNMLACTVREPSGTIDDDITVSQPHKQAQEQSRDWNLKHVRYLAGEVILWTSFKKKYLVHILPNKAKVNMWREEISTCTFFWCQHELISAMIGRRETKREEREERGRGKRGRGRKRHTIHIRIYLWMPLSLSLYNNCHC